jgi:hypothetical protein
LENKSRIEIRDSLWFIYSQYPVNVGALQRDRIAQLIALIGKREFPESHPEFVQSIISLTKVKFVLGITLIKACSNEIVSTKPEPYIQKAKFLQRYVISKKK